MKTATNSKLKYALASFLAVVLAVVVFKAVLPTSLKPVCEPQNTTIVPTQTVAETKTVSATPDSAAQTVLPIPTVEMKQLTSFDPFRTMVATAEVSDAIELKNTFQPQAVESVDTVVSNETAAKAISVSAIITGGQRPAALIGGRLCYENDVLGDGWKIVAIKASSVVVCQIASAN